MKIMLLNATKERLIRELRHILSVHPRYKEHSQNVVNKYSFKERPQIGIIVNSTSGDRVRLSADNYLGRLSSFCMLTWVENNPCTSLEWVRENFAALESVSKARDIFPSDPGVYIITICTLPDEARQVPGTFSMEPLYTVRNELLTTFGSSADFDAQLSRDNIYPGSLRLWLEGRIGLIPGADFSINYETGEVVFNKTTPTNQTIYADYRYISPTLGPFQFKQEEFNIDAIPGCVLAFGDRCQLSDKMAVVITDERTDVADVYGGKYEMNFGLIAYTRDSEEREKLTDYVIAKVLESQNNWGSDGIELLDVSPGGEDEEIQNTEGDDYYYESTINLSVRVDWEAYIPLPITIIRDSFSSRMAEEEHGTLDGTIPADLLRPISSTIEANTIPFYVGKKIYYERLR